ncbi:hypothetical protein ACFRAO_09260 [Streptomyces sp. NPDC056656]|uniref:hypothetical protein n=1 Tax=Streptomyces sp. NPDC056656 TaxID=3345895 RepID=UPI0036C83A21
MSRSGNKFTMKVTVHALDQYDFNAGAADIASGSPDSENGRLAVLGWAHPYLSRGTVTRNVTWTLGQAGSTTMAVDSGHDRHGRWAGASWMLVVAAAASVIALTGCGSGAATSADTSRAAASDSKDGALRHDRQPVADRFPELGDFTSVVWASDVLGQDSRGAPGPSDVRMSGVVRLTAAQSEDLRKRYAWHSTPERPDVVEHLASHVPQAGEWKDSDDFTEAVTGGRYSASFSVDFGRGVAVFEAVNPERKNG